MAMKMSAEQKRNMLILAGYEPYLFSGIFENQVRILKPMGNYYLRLSNDPWEVDEISRAMARDYIPSEWHQMRLGTCPVRLIHAAVDGVKSPAY